MCASLTADADDLPEPGFTLVPAAAQQSAFLFPPHQHRDRSSHPVLIVAGRRQWATDTAHCYWLCNPMKCVGSQIIQGKSPLDEPCRHRTDHHSIGRGKTLEPRRDVGWFPEREMLVPSTTPHHPHHHGAGVDAEPYGELHPVRCRQTGIQGCNGLDNA
jgi:hypothetical protein